MEVGGECGEGGRGGWREKGEGGGGGGEFKKPIVSQQLFPIVEKWMYWGQGIIERGGGGGWEGRRGKRNHVEEGRGSEGREGREGGGGGGQTHFPSLPQLNAGIEKTSG